MLVLPDVQVESWTDGWAVDGRYSRQGRKEDASVCLTLEARVSNLGQALCRNSRELADLLLRAGSMWLLTVKCTEEKGSDNNTMSASSQTCFGEYILGVGRLWGGSVVVVLHICDHCMGT